MEVERGYLRQDIQLRQEIGDGTTMPFERGHLEHDIWDRITRLGELGQDIWDRNVRTGHLRQERQDRTVWTGQFWQVRPTGQPGQVSREKTEMTGLPGNDSGVRRAVNKVAWAGKLEQEDGWDGID
jgi:hypothetical protein